MIDHVLGRPSVRFRKVQVVAVVSFWSLYLYRGPRHGPPIIRRISALLSKRLTTWQTLLITLLYLYVARNFGKLVGLECPEPLANLYSRSYFRATWVTTALDAGFWSAMRIRRKWLRDFMSMVFSLYYMICAEQADEKVRKIRATLTVDHLRVSWNKGTTPYLAALSSMLRPRLMRYPPRAIRIPRPKESSYKEPVHAWLYFDGPIAALKRFDKMVLDIPGGGFVAMNPRTHDDKLMGWAGKTGLPVLSIDYKKAPEYPYPYALNECYDVYHTLIATRGRCVGLAGEREPKIVVSGDSAGGNLAVGMVLMILQSGSTETRQWMGERELPAPAGVVLIYPALDMNIGNWMTDEQMALIRDRRVRKTNQGILRRKSDDYRHLAPNTPHHSDDEDSDDEDRISASPNPDSTHPTPLGSTFMTSPQTTIHPSAAHTNKDTTATTTKPQNDTQTPNPAPAPQATQLKTRLAMSSMISYFNDRILTPEMMRAMIILYIGPHNRPDFSTDYLLSPLLAPESLLARFPKTWMLTGERDPLVDDTVIFAGRLRQAKRAEWVFGREMGLEWARGIREFRDEDWVEVDLIPGCSHGFLQFVGVFPEGWKYIFRTAKWMSRAFREAEDDELERLDRLEREVRRTSAARGNGAARKAAGGRDDYFGAAAVGSSMSTETVVPGRNGFVTASNGGNGNHGADSPERRRHHYRSSTTSSADEDRPLEMTVIRPKTSPAASSANENGSASKEGMTTTSSSSSRNPTKPSPASGSRGHARTAGRGNRASKGENNKSRRKSSSGFASVGSEDDLLGRRMKGLAGGLMGVGSGESGVPPTP